MNTASFLLLRRFALQAAGLRYREPFEKLFTEAARTIHQTAGSLKWGVYLFTWPLMADGSRFNESRVRNDWEQFCTGVAEECDQRARETGEIPNGWRGELPSFPLTTRAAFADWIRSAVASVQRTNNLGFAQELYDDAHRWLLAHPIEGCPGWSDAPNSLSGCERALIRIAVNVNVAAKNEFGPKKAIDGKADIVSRILWHHHFDEDGIVRPDAIPLNMQEILNRATSNMSPGQKKGWSIPSLSRCLRARIFHEFGHGEYVSLATNDHYTLRSRLQDSLPWLPQTDGNETVSKISTKMKR